MPLSPVKGSFGQLAVLAGDANGLNPSTNTRYFFAQNVNVDPQTANSQFQHVTASPAVLTGYSVVATVVGNKDNGGNLAAFSVRVDNATDYGTQNLAFSTSQQTVGVDGLSVPLAKGAQLQITFLTPATFTTPPTLIFFAGGISVSDP